MIFKLIPYEGSDIVKLGMNSTELQKLTNSKVHKLKKTKWRLYDTEQFEMFQAEYDSFGVCISLQFYNPASILFQDTQLINSDFNEVKALFHAIDENLNVEEDNCLISPKYQIGIYASGNPAKVETVLVAKADYYTND